MLKSILSILLFKSHQSGGKTEEEGGERGTFNSWVGSLFFLVFYEVGILFG